MHLALGFVKRRQTWKGFSQMCARLRDVWIEDLWRSHSTRTAHLCLLSSELQQCLFSWPKFIRYTGNLLRRVHHCHPELPIPSVVQDCHKHPTARTSSATRTTLGLTFPDTTPQALAKLPHLPCIPRTFEAFHWSKACRKIGDTQISANLCTEIDIHANHGKCCKSTCNSEISKCRLELPHKQSHALNTTGGSCTETGTSANYILLEVVPKKKLT